MIACASVVGFGTFSVSIICTSPGLGRYKDSPSTSVCPFLSGKAFENAYIKLSTG